ncbi:MAG: hypothetical protein WBO45_11050 [Planctomycetota bacterium]
MSLVASLPAQDPAPAKGPDKEVADKIAVLKEVVADRKCARDDEGVSAIDVLLQKVQKGAEPKDQQAIVKALENVMTSGKLRPHDDTRLYRGAIYALGDCGAEGAKVLKDAYANKRYPDKPDWVPLREHVLKHLGRTKDPSMVKFLINEAVRSPEAALSASAGEALGNFEQNNFEKSNEPVRKEIVSELLRKYGELAEKASQIGTNIEAQNANDRLAAIKDKWDSTLARLTGQNFKTFREWQAWHNKNKGAAW